MSTTISIHAPREGGDRRTSSVRTLRCTFQSTPPARGATTVLLGTIDHLLISIHAPREGGDPGLGHAGRRRIGISIHAPREGGDSVCCLLVPDNKKISIHAPREGGDVDSVVAINNF